MEKTRTGLNAAITSLRTELHRLLSKKNTNNSEILNLSQQLDELILLYYKPHSARNGNNPESGPHFIV